MTIFDTSNADCLQIASYSDPRWFGLIISPLADCDLKAYYDLCKGDEARLATLRTFYGCLAAGLDYLYLKKIRHRDIKPENILVKGETVYLTDFGISLDWELLSGSTTSENSAKTWIYCAPEVAENEPRNTSADVWSLGCVFLEMTTILSGLEINDMREYFKSKKAIIGFIASFLSFPNGLPISDRNSHLQITFLWPG